MLLAFTCALLTAVPVDTLAPNAGLPELKAKCIEMREGLLESCREDHRVRLLFRDVQAEADALDRVATRSPLPCMCLGAAGGGCLGALGGVLVAGVLSGSSGSGPFDILAGMVVAAMASLIGGGAGVLLGASGAATSRLVKRHDDIVQHRDLVAGLVRRYNRLMAGIPPPRHRPLPCPPGRLF